MRHFRNSFIIFLAFSLSGPVSAETEIALDPAVLSHCLARLKASARSKGIRAETYDFYTRDLAPDPTVLRLLDSQPEFRTPIWDYLAGLIDEERVEDGRARLRDHRETLDRIAARYKVDPAIVVSIWGVETDYGRVFGQRPIRSSLATLSCFGRRQNFFRAEFISLLQLLQNEDIRDEDLKGSWAGAFGHTQFMPSVYARIAVDEDGDGHRNLVKSIPDALASTANYLKQAGWRNDLPWGYEISLPARFDAGWAGRKKRQPVDVWRERGVQLIDGTPLPDLDVKAAVLLPAGMEGPAFLLLPNFDALYAYNPAESYALAIALLSDRLKGGRGLEAAWPTDDPGLGRKDRRTLQTLLLQRGHDIGEADGIIGNRTRRAIQIEEKRLGWKKTEGRAGKKILETLSAEAAQKDASSDPAD